MGARGFVVLVLAMCCLSAVAESRGAPPEGQSKKSGDSRREPEPPPLPTDERLLELHREFVTSAERLALEYEHKKEYDKAKAVYGEIRKLVPQYLNAQRKLDELRLREATAHQASVKVLANEPWQNTGIRCIKGKPIHLKAAGVWTFTLTIRVSPEGIQVPKDLRDYNLGCLVGAIDTGDIDEFRPFVIGNDHSIIAPVDGTLMMRMYDIDPTDNVGEVDVDVQGTFETLARKPKTK